MNGFLLDTNAVSELVSVKPNQRVLDWLEAGEIRQGVAALTPSKKRKMLETWLEVDLQSRFADRVLPVDRAVADRWGRLMAQSQGKGMTKPVVDCLPAATAFEHDLTVVTRNVEDFSVTGLSVINPWRDV